MLKREKQVYIVQHADMHNKVLYNALSHELYVSEDTTRKDLPALNEKIKLIKAHAGALSHSFSNIRYPSQKVYTENNKKIAAQKVANLLFQKN